MCINNPETGELITDTETIKKVSLEHNVKILTKNPIRNIKNPVKNVREPISNIKYTSRSSWAVGHF